MRCSFGHGRGVDCTQEAHLSRTSYCTRRTHIPIRTAGALSDLANTAPRFHRFPLPVVAAATAREGKSLSDWDEPPSGGNSSSAATVTVLSAELPRTVEGPFSLGNALLLGSLCLTTAAAGAAFCEVPVEGVCAAADEADAEAVSGGSFGLDFATKATVGVSLGPAFGCVAAESVFVSVVKNGEEKRDKEGAAAAAFEDAT